LGNIHSDDAHVIAGGDSCIVVGLGGPGKRADAHDDANAGATHFRACTEALDRIDRTASNVVDDYSGCDKCGSKQGCDAACSARPAQTSRTRFAHDVKDTWQSR
jgi:hypothetical protein